jgi:hypothetical protein
VVPSNNIETDKELVGWLLLRNSELEARSNEDWLATLKGNDKAKVRGPATRYCSIGGGLLRALAPQEGLCSFFFGV